MAHRLTVQGQKHPRRGTTHSRGRTVCAQTGGQASPTHTPTLDTMSWQISPRTTKTTPKRVYKLKVYSTKFEQYMPSGERPFVVNPANRWLTNGAGLAATIAQGAGPEYTAWCIQTVGAQADQALRNGEVVVCGPYRLRQRGYQGIVNVAMENISLGTDVETQKTILIGYYTNRLVACKYTAL